MAGPNKTASPSHLHSTPSDQGDLFDAVGDAADVAVLEAPVIGVAAVAAVAEVSQSTLRSRVQAIAAKTAAPKPIMVEPTSTVENDAAEDDNETDNDADDHRDAGAEIDLKAEDVAAYYKGKSTQMYLSNIGQYTNLDADEEVDLSTRAKAGDGRAMNKLIESNLRLVVSVVKRYRKSINAGGVEFDDLVQEGNMGLMRAVEKFNPELGFRFTTYALPWIHQFVRRSIMNTSATIRVPVHVHTAAAKNRKTEAAENEEGDLIQKLKGTVSIDAPTGGNHDEDNFSSIGDMLVDSSDNPEASMANAQVRAVLMQWLKELRPREREILCAKFGIPNGEPRTLEQLSEEFGITKQALSLIQLKAQKKLLVIAQDRKMEFKDFI